ncbi:xylulokinase [Nakamurella sp. YIM 132087]|uniref:Xylulokinase n=1 Tax=Nakamurella alba TaxID=2665158 RepID=A0A7K1FNK9_9ACTN|nr:FGGY family carbohydrate kinase [Nakamurella alba]MTD15757.1 xylulokinase [Nakamurella alba]
MTRRFRLGVDIGTSSVKVALHDQESQQRTAFRSSHYPSAHPAPDRVEQDQDDWWRAVGEALTALLHHHPAVTAGNSVIGLTGQMHTTTLLSADDRPLRPAILWSDRRAAELCAAYNAAHPEHVDVTGNPLLAAFTAAHLRWLRAHEPEVLSRTRKVLVPKDLVRLRLGAGYATEPADASATALLDTRSGQWDSDLAAGCGIDLDRLPPVLPSAAVTGEIAALPDGDPVLRRLLGSPVVGGAGDQAALGIALDVTAPGALGLSLGTSGVAISASDHAVPGAFRHALPDTWLRLDSIHAAGLALTWWSGIAGRSVDDLLAEVAGAGTGGPVFVPHLQGGRDGDHAAGGSFTGLRADHTRADLTRAVLAGVAGEMTGLAAAVTDGVLPARVAAGGRGASSPLWRSLLGAALGREILPADGDSADGAALLAGHADL